MDLSGSNTDIWSRGQEVISNAAHDVPAKNNVPQPPRADAGLSTTATIAARILLGHYNVDGTSRVSNRDVTDSIRSLAAVGLHVSPDKALVSSSCSGLITPTSSTPATTATTKDVFPSDSSDLDMLDKIPPTHKLSELTARRLHGLVAPNKQPSSAGAPTLTSSSDLIGIPIKAPGPASSFPWNTNLTRGGSSSTNKLALTWDDLVKKPEFMAKAAEKKRNAEAKADEKKKERGAKEAEKKRSAEAKVGRRAVWTPEEDTKFLEALSTSGKDWTAVSKYLGTKSTAQVRYHARRYGKIGNALEAPSAALAAFEHFVQCNDHSVQEMFPEATPMGQRYLLNSKWSTIKPSIKAKFFRMAEKDAARFHWEKKVYLAIRGYRPPVPYSVAIQNIRDDIRQIFPNITKEGEQRLLKERAKRLQPPGGVRPISKRAKRAKRKL